MKAFVRNFALAALAAAGLAGAASAGVVSCSVSGATSTCSINNPPPVVGNNSVNKNVLFAFDEKQNVALSSPLNIDVVAGSLPVGTRVASHYIVYDPGRRGSIEATITFDRKILGLIITKANLDASNHLGLASVFYDTSRLIGLEAAEGDGITFSNKMTTMHVTASSPGDHIRVITAAVPLPAGGLLLLGGLGAFALLRRRKAAA